MIAARPMFVLVAAVAVLLGAPLVDGLLVRTPRLTPGLDAALGVAIGAAVFGAVLPWGAGVLGWGEAVAVLGGGAVIGLVAHRFPALGDAVNAFAFVGLALHALVDGVALAGSVPTMGLAVVAHNLPVGLALWRTVAPENPRMARLALLFSAFITVAGWMLAAHVAEVASAAPMAMLQLAAGGMLLHAAWHLLERARRWITTRARR